MTIIPTFVICQSNIDDLEVVSFDLLWSFIFEKLSDSSKRINALKSLE